MKGDVWQYTAFLCNGCAGMYRVDDKGLEHILRFSVETWWVGDRESYTTGNPAQSNIEALEDCDILMWQKKDLDKLHQQIPGLTAFVDGLLARSLNAFHNRVYAMISNTAEEKYNNLIKNYPGIFNRVPLHMIASYLGVTRETLSRIRRRHATK